jgi:plastocyanin
MLMPTHRHRGTLFVLASVFLLAGLLGAGVWSPRPTRAAAGHDMRAMRMDPNAMKSEIRAWYVAHPAHGRATIEAAAADTFLVNNFIFDTDGNLATQIDTAHVQAGQSVMFKWVGGFHTTTSGNPGDVDAGSLWDAPIDNFAPADLEFVVNFPNAGTFPFHCQPHGSLFNMRGVIVVGGNVSVPQGTLAGVGFTRSPGPNPSRAGVSFQFAVEKPGAVHAEVFDAAGRRVAVMLDRSFDRGVHSATWDGRDAAGARVGAGIYYLRLRTPDVSQTRQVTLER